MTRPLVLTSIGQNNTVCQFCSVSRHGSYHGMYRRTQAVCDTKLPCSRTRQKRHALHTPSREHISPLIPKDKLYEAKLPITAWQRDGLHNAARRPCWKLDSWPTMTWTLTSCGLGERFSDVKMTRLVRLSVMQMPPSVEVLFISFHALEVYVKRATLQSPVSLYVPPV
jgi:hypothetical protein